MFFNPLCIAVSAQYKQFWILVIPISLTHTGTEIHQNPTLDVLRQDMSEHQKHFI